MSSSDSEKNSHLGHTVDKSDVDVAAQLVAGSDGELDKYTALRLRCVVCALCVLEIRRLLLIRLDAKLTGTSCLLCVVSNILILNRPLLTTCASHVLVSTNADMCDLE